MKRNIIMILGLFFHLCLCISFADAAPDLNEELLEAAKNGDYAGVQRSLDNGAKIDATDRLYWTPLHHAAYKGHKEVVELLLDRLLLDSEATIDPKNIWGETPLHCAVMNGENKYVVETLLYVKQFLDFGINVLTNGAKTSLKNYYTEDIDIPVTIASIANEKVVELLLNKGASVNMKSLSGSTPLHHAALCGSKEIIMVLLNNGADIDAMDLYHETPLHHAAARLDGGKEIIELLIIHGAYFGALYSLNKMHYYPCDIAEREGNKEYYDAALRDATPLLTK